MCIKPYLLWRPYVLYFMKPLFTMDILDKLSRANSQVQPKSLTDTSTPTFNTVLLSPQVSRCPRNPCLTNNKMSHRLCMYVSIIYNIDFITAVWSCIR